MTTPAIEVNDLSVVYDDLTALAEVSFDIAPGSFVAIIGPNGSGKSTLINALLGIEPRARGTVRLFGAEPADIPAKDIGYVPQLKTLDRSFPATALELVVSGLRHAWPWRVSPGERDTALEAMGRTGVADIADRPVSALSGGELQRTYLARSLVQPRRLLLLDEPGAGMDVTGEAEMYHLLEVYRTEINATVLMVTHDWEGARAHATHVLLINRGLAGFGPPAEFGDDARLLELFGHKGHIGATHKGDGDA